MSVKLQWRDGLPPPCLNWDVLRLSGFPGLPAFVNDVDTCARLEVSTTSCSCTFFHPLVLGEPVFSIHIRFGPAGFTKVFPPSGACYSDHLTARHVSCLDWFMAVTTSKLPNDAWVPALTWSTPLTLTQHRLRVLQRCVFISCQELLVEIRAARDHCTLSRLEDELCRNTSQ
jgi:hypothetical protein